MKQTFRMLVVAVMFVVTLFSCTKEEAVVTLNADVLRAQLAAIIAPEKEEVQIILSEKSLKSAYIEEDDAKLVEIFALDSRTYDVYNDKVIKYFVYYEIDSSGYRTKLLTISQEFKVVNGAIDTSSYVLDYQVGCQFSRYFNLKNRNSVEKISYFFRFDDGKQFAYYGDGGSDIKLPPIAGGKWQILVSYNDGDLRQQFSSGMIDYYSDNNMINLNLQLKPENTVSILQIDKDHTVGSYMIQISGRDENGNYRYFSSPIMYDENLPGIISFNVPFSIENVVIYGMNGGWGYEVMLSPVSPIFGPKIYVINYGVN